MITKLVCETEHFYYEICMDDDPLVDTDRFRLQYRDDIQIGEIIKLPFDDREGNETGEFFEAVVLSIYPNWQGKTWETQSYKIHCFEDKATVQCEAYVGPKECNIRCERPASWWVFPLGEEVSSVICDSHKEEVQEALNRLHGINEQGIFMKFKVT